MRQFFNALKFVAFVALFWGVISLGSCAPARTILKQANLDPAPYAPAKLNDINASFNALETAIYGEFIPPTEFTLKTSEFVAADWLDGKATVERRMYTVSHGQPSQDVEIIFVMPTENTDVPIIISQNFSSNSSVIAIGGDSQLSDSPSNMGIFGPIFRYFFGRHIVEPPLEEIIERGYGFVAMHPPDYIADRQDGGTSQLNLIFGARADRPGALTVWASLTTALAKDLKAEIPSRPIIAYGHSRYGKTALLAAAYGEGVDGAVAHQSGTAGASLMRDQAGESLKDLVRGYPQWLTPSAESYTDSPKTLPSDAHALLAFIAPKPILLGNARRDVWSDPEGAYQAAKWASQNTTQTFSAERLDDFIPSDDIAFWTRPGTHGVVKEDWPAFLDFMDAHFK